jgi:hypothetical protein
VLLIALIAPALLMYLAFVHSQHGSLVTGIGLAGGVVVGFLLAFAKLERDGLGRTAHVPV